MPDTFKDELMFCHGLKRVAWLTLMAMVSFSIGCRSGGSASDNHYRNSPYNFASERNQPAYTIAGANPAADQFSGPHPVEDYIQLGLMQNSEIEEVRLMVASLSNRVPQAASLPDPMLGATAFPAPVQTAAGEQDFALAMNQKIPWRGKLATRAAIAEQEVNAARSRLAAVKLKVVEQIKNAYFQLYFVQQAITIIEDDKKQLELIKNVVNEMYRVKQEVTQQDWLQVDVALSRVEAQLIKFRADKKSAQAKLVRLLHVSPETELEAMDHLPPERTVQDIQHLYEMAVRCRPELHAQLATIQRDRKATCLAELENYPDLTFGFNWIATSSDGISPVASGDDAFLLTLGMNLPVRRNRIDAGVREAQTRALSNARKYDRLKDETIEGVADLFAKVNSLEETLQLFRNDIIPKQELTLSQSFNDYRVNKVDILQLLQSWRQLFQFHLTEKRFEADLQKALASLARQIGNVDLPDGVAPVQPDVDQIQNDKPDEDETGQGN